MTKKQQKNETQGEAESETGTGFSFESLGDVHAEIQGESSEPNTRAIEAAQEITIDEGKLAAGNKDKTGAIFDAKIHAVNAQGEPSVTPLGKFRKRRGISSVASTNKAMLEAQHTEQEKAAAQATGRLAADLMIGSAVSLIGPEWQPQGAEGETEAIKFNEHENLRRAFGDYCEAKGVHDIPPGIALTIAISAYIMPRIIAGEETKSKMQRAKVWLADKYYKMQKGRSKKNAAQSNTRNDGERKDDTSKENGGAKSPEKARGDSA